MGKITWSVTDGMFEKMRLRCQVLFLNTTQRLVLYDRLLHCIGRTIAAAVIGVSVGNSNQEELWLL